MPPCIAVDSIDTHNLSARIQPDHEEILQLSPHLRDVTVYLDPGYFNLQPPSHPCQSPWIRTVALNGLDSMRTCGLPDALGSMETPKLKEIHLIRCTQSPLTGIPSLVQRSRCSLETLVLYRTRVRSAELLALLPTIPTLGTLVLVDNSTNATSDIGLERLTPSSSDLNGRILPTLHTLVLRGVYFCNTDKLLTLLESRIRFQCPVNNLNIALSARDICASELDRFAALPGAVATYSPRMLSVSAGFPR
ncbi:hypothetical protein C8R45DRAFT_1099969 [Mycena sanguinolenta]|nr:hypothetical protein C8R45DRAFT_1099969 [Mycena sanguinolenta]